jgi:phosphodiesterase/alkaline phosphatase D-like protein
MLDATVRVRTRALDDRYIGPAESSLWRLGARLENDPSIRFTVLTGDQVYVDRTAGLFDPGRLLERLSFAYEAFLLNAGLQRVLRVAGAEIFPMLDDHEVADNWEPRPRGYGHDELQDEMAQGRRLYVMRQRSMWPQAVRGTVSDKRLWLATELHGHAFFFTDTRSRRQGRTIGNLAHASILGKPQSAELHKWIRAQGPESPPSFVVSASIVLPRYLSMRGRPGGRNPLGLALQTDSWAGYPGSLHTLLARLYDANAQRVVFLSGDEHLSCIASITIECMFEARKVVVYSVHSSALYAPYTFANSSIDDFAAHESFEFIDEQKHAGLCRKFRCHVETFFPDSGDGFAILRPYQSAQGAWHLDVEFDGARRKVMRTLNLA